MRMAWGPNLFLHELCSDLPSNCTEGASQRPSFLSDAPDYCLEVVKPCKLKHLGHVQLKLFAARAASTAIQEHQAILRQVSAAQGLVCQL
jgi:hypothetical protein